MNLDKVIIEPVLTEKSNKLRDMEKRKYIFKVDKRANKIQILEALRKLFSVHPESCNIVNVSAKPRTSRSKSGYRKGSTAEWKKAIITLKAGEKLDIFDGV